MKYKTLFRVLLKVVGVWLVVQGLGDVTFMMTQFITQDEDIGLPFFFYASQSVYAFVYIGVGLYLFFGGKWIANLAIPGNRTYCHECGYELRRVAGHICPECGTTFRRDPDTQAPPRLDRGARETN